MLFLFVWFLVFLVFRDRVSLCSPGCPGTHFVDQAGLELRNLPASASQVLGLKASATTARPNPYSLVWFMSFQTWVLRSCNPPRQYGTLSSQSAVPNTRVEVRGHSVEVSSLLPILSFQELGRHTQDDQELGHLGVPRSLFKPRCSYVYNKHGDDVFP